MPADSRVPLERPASPAKARLLEVADDLFYGEGIHTVGIDRLIAAAGVTKATFYKQFGSKENLILEYIVQRDSEVRRVLTRVSEDARSGLEVLRWDVANVIESSSRPGFRGCAFMNAAAEFADPQHPVRMAIADHREWYQDFLTQQLKRSGHPYPGDGADELFLLHDGAIAGSYAGDPVAAQTALLRAAERIFAEASPRAA